MNVANLSQPVDFGDGAQVLLLQAAARTLVRLVAHRADNSCPHHTEPEAGRAGLVRRASRQPLSSLIATESKPSGIEWLGHPERHPRIVEVRQHGLP